MLASRFFRIRMSLPVSLHRVKLLVMREKILSEYLSRSSSRFRFVEIKVALLRRYRSFRQENSCEVIKLLVVSVPRSSMISRSQPYRSSHKSYRMSFDFASKE